MNSQSLENDLAACASAKIQSVMNRLWNDIQIQIKESEEFQTNAQNPEDKEFHRGVIVGMKHIAILVGRLEF